MGTLNQRVRVENGSSSQEYAYNIQGQRVSAWDGSTHAEISGQYYWGSSPIAFYSGASLHFQHQNWMGTERSRTSYTGAVEGRYQSLTFGDGFAVSGSDDDQNHYAMLDRDADDTHHAQFRQYSSTQERWMSPDPYDGSYDLSDPQSFNRYVYVRNNPLAMVDPSGQSGVCLGAFPYGTAEPNQYLVNPWINNSFDCESGYGTWVETGSDQTLDVNSNDGPDSMDPSSGPGLGAVAINPSSSGGGGGGGSSTSAPNKPTVIPNPCPYQGRALPPSAYAMAGQQANGSPVNFTLDVTMGFPAGHYLDPQPLGSGNVYQNQAYGNYTLGVYMASAGVSLSTALSGANVYAFFRASYPSWTQMDPNYKSLPAANVANITNGYNAQMSGTTCHN